MPVRTKNAAEIAVCDHLEAEGYTVLKNGWPDFLAYRDGEVRFIEVKPHSGRRLSPRQQTMASALRPLGVTVEMMTPENV